MDIEKLKNQRAIYAQNKEEPYMSVQEDLALRKAKELFEGIQTLIAMGKITEAFDLYSLYGNVINGAPSEVKAEILHMRGLSSLAFIDYFSQRGMMSDAEGMFSNLDEMNRIVVKGDVILKDQCAFGIGLIIMGYFMVSRDFGKTDEWYREFLEVVAEIPQEESSENLNKMISSLVNTLPPALTMNVGLPSFA